MPMNFVVVSQLFHDEGPYHTKTSLLICIANQWTGFYMIGTSVMKVNYWIGINIRPLIDAAEWYLQSDQ